MSKIVGRKKKNQVVKATEETDQVVESSEVGVPGLFQPGASDINEELQGNEALWQHNRESGEI